MSSLIRGDFLWHGDHGGVDPNAETQLMEALQVEGSNKDGQADDEPVYDFTAGGRMGRLRQCPYRTTHYDRVSPSFGAKYRFVL